MMIEADRQQVLEAWYSKPLGQVVLQTELQLVLSQLEKHYSWANRRVYADGKQCVCLQPNLPNHFLQLDLPAAFYRVTVQMPDPMIASQQPRLWSEAQALPLLSNTVDLVVLPHLLEYTQSPQTLLAEYCRVLKPNGYLFVLGFNPLSVLGLQRFLGRFHMGLIGRFLTKQTVIAQLKSLSCPIESVHPYALTLMGLAEKANWLSQQCEAYAKRCLPFFCSAYLIVAQKKVVPFTLIRPRFKKVIPIGDNLLKPSAHYETGKDGV